MKMICDAQIRDTALGHLRRYGPLDPALVRALRRQLPERSVRRPSVVVVALALAVGCSSREPAAPTWSETEAIVTPEPPPPPPPPPAPQGRLLVHPQLRPGAAAPKGESRSASYRGYSVFDDKGTLLFTGHLADSDERWLPPGRYVAIATLKSGFLGSRTRERRIQFVIVADRTTIIDFSGVPDQPPRSQT
jgi:hypothetical protein